MRPPARRLLFGVTAPVTARSFLRGQLAHHVATGWEVHLLCGEQGLDDFSTAEGVHGLHVVRASREPSLRDPWTLASIWRVLRRTRPAAVVMGTPKMGVLGTIAARAAGVQTRVYLVHGYRADGLTGMRRRVLQTLERAACAAATDVVAVSESLAARLRREAVADPAKVRVLGSGSANGVDLQRFLLPDQAAVADARVRWGVPTDAEVVASVGRLTRDKGLRDLPVIWGRLSAVHPTAWLLVAGSPEPSGDLDRDALVRLSAMPRVRMLGQLADVEQVYWAADLLLLLSEREGLGMVALEAAACGVPTVGSRVTGVVDAVHDGQTGILLRPGDLAAVVSAVSDLLVDPQRRASLGAAALARTTELFGQETVWREWDALLDEVAGRDGTALTQP